MFGAVFAHNSAEPFIGRSRAAVILLRSISAYQLLTFPAGRPPPRDAPLRKHCGALSGAGCYACLPSLPRRGSDSLPLGYLYQIKICERDEGWIRNAIEIPVSFELPGKYVLFPSRSVVN